MLLNLRVKFPIILCLFLILASCDGGGGGNGPEACEPFSIAFTPIPECVSEYFLEVSTNCSCIGEGSEFDLSLLNFDIDGYTGFITPYDIVWEPVDCSTISFSGETSGVLENMTVPEEGILEFTLSFEGTKPEGVTCCCGDFFVVD